MHAGLFASPRDEDSRRRFHMRRRLQLGVEPFRSGLFPGEAFPEYRDDFFDPPEPGTRQGDAVFSGVLQGRLRNLKSHPARRDVCLSFREAVLLQLHQGDAGVAFVLASLLGQERVAAAPLAAEADGFAGVDGPYVAGLELVGQQATDLLPDEGAAG